MTHCFTLLPLYRSPLIAPPSSHYTTRLSLHIFFIAVQADCVDQGSDVNLCNWSVRGGWDSVPTSSHCTTLLPLYHPPLTALLSYCSTLHVHVPLTDYTTLPLLYPPPIDLPSRCLHPHPTDPLLPLIPHPTA